MIKTDGSSRQHVEPSDGYYDSDHYTEEDIEKSYELERDLENHELDDDSDYLISDYPDALEFAHKLERMFINRFRIESINLSKFKIIFPMHINDDVIDEVYIIIKDDKAYVSDEGKTLDGIDDKIDKTQLETLLKKYQCGRNGDEIIMPFTRSDFPIKLGYMYQLISALRIMSFLK